jgi:formyl-CoA transferase
VYASLARILTERTTAEWLELAAELGIPAGPVATVDEIIEDPQRHRGVLVESEHPVVGTYRQIAPAVRFDRTPAAVRVHAPLLGQDTVAVLRDIGLSEAEIKDLIAAGAAAG